MSREIDEVVYQKGLMSVSVLSSSMSLHATQQVEWLREEIERGPGNIRMGVVIPVMEDLYSYSIEHRAQHGISHLADLAVHFLTVLGLKVEMDGVVSAASN